MFKLQSPIQTGEFIAALSTSANNTTDWTNLTSADFKNTVNGLSVPAGQAFGEVSVYNPGLNDAFIKLRARTVAGDTTASELRILAGGSLSLNVLGLKAGSVEIISYKKGAAGDDLFFTCSFFRSEI